MLFLVLLVFSVWLMSLALIFCYSYIYEWQAVLHQYVQSASSWKFQLLRLSGMGRLSMTHSWCHLEMILWKRQLCAFCKILGISSGFVSALTPPKPPAESHSSLCLIPTLEYLQPFRRGSLCKQLSVLDVQKKETLLLFSRSSYSWLILQNLFALRAQNSKEWCSSTCI